MGSELKSPEAIAEQWLSAWGAVVRERKVTGDQAAIPRAIFQSGGRGHRGSPSSMNAIVDAFVDIQDCISLYDSKRLVDLLTHCYVDVVETIVGYRYTLPGGEAVTLPPEAKAPVRATANEALIHQKPQSPATFRLTPDELKVLAGWHILPEHFLKTRVDRFKKFVIITKGLDSL